MGTNPTTMGDILQPELDRVIEWGQRNGLSFNPSKTTAILFRKNKRNVKLPILSIGGTALEFHDSIKYLGILIHRSLAWLPHIRSRTSKCNALLSKCRSIISRSWGLTPKKMEWIHKAIIQPKITYGSVVWASSITEPIRKRLNRTQRLSLTSFIHPLRSAPTAGLEVMMGWMPMALHAEEVGMNTYLRIQDTIQSNWNGIGQKGRLMGHISLWRKKSLSLDNFPRLKQHQRFFWKDRKQPPPIRGISIYSDASKSAENVGFAWAAFQGDYILDEHVSSAKEVNVYQAEIMAIKEALSWIKDLELTDTITIYSDSQSAVLALNNYVSSDSLTHDTMELLAELDNVTLEWVKGHNNVTGNEYADMLARIGAEEAKNISYSSPFLPVSRNTFKSLVHKRYLKRWQSQWESLINCRISRLFMPKTGHKKISLSSYELQLLSQIVTGHGLFKRHIGHWTEIPNISCALCNEAEEDSWHLWEYCPVLRDERNTLLCLVKNGMKIETAFLRFLRLNKIKELMASNEALICP